MVRPSRRIVIDPSSPYPHDPTLFPLDPFPPLDSFPLPPSSPTASYSLQDEAPERAPSPLLPDSPLVSLPPTADTQFPSFMRRTYNHSITSMGSMIVPTLNHGSSIESSRTVSPARDRMYSSFPRPQEREIESALGGDVHPTATQDSAQRIGSTTDSTEFTDRSSTCSGCSQCSGELVITGALAISSTPPNESPAISATRNFNSLQQVSIPLRGESEQQASRALPSVASPIGVNEPATTWGRSRPLGRLPLFDRVEAAKKINLKESETFEQEHPTSRHYEGCILCTPQPSPRSSLASSGEDDLLLFLAPSKQSAGPPPTEPLPALADPGTCPVPEKPSSPIIVISPPDSSENYGLTPGESNKEELLGELDDGDDGLESFPVRKQEDGYFVPTIGVATKVYLKPDPYSCGIGHLPSNSGVDLVKKSTIRRHSEPVGKRDSSSHSASSETREGEAITLGRPNSGDAKAPRTRTRSFPVISPAKDFASGVNHKRSSWTGVFGDPGSNNGFDPTGRETRSSSRQPPGPQPALSFGRALSPHPGGGIRDSYTGVDGAFEMVDLGSSTSTVAADLPTGKAHKFSLTRTMGNSWGLKSFRLPNYFQMSQRQKWVAIGVVLFGGLLLVIAILILVGGPLILKRALSSADVEVQSFEIRDFSPDSLSVNLKLKLNSDERSNIPLGATMYNLVINNSLVPSEMPSQLEGKPRSLSPAPDYAPGGSAIRPKRARDVPNTIFEPGFLGNFSTDATSLRDGVGIWTVASKVTLGTGRDSRLRDPRAWSGFMLSLVNRETVGMRVYGKVEASFMGARRKIDISKEVTIKGKFFPHDPAPRTTRSAQVTYVLYLGLGGFGGIKIKDYSNFYGPQTRFFGELNWYNPSQLTLSLPNISFLVFIGDQKIGYARLEAQTITPGDNTLRSFYGGLDTDILRANRTLLGMYLSGFFPQGITEAQNMLQLQGNSTDVDGIEIPWLLPAIQSIGFPLPLVSPEMSTSAHALPMGDAPKWQFIFATNDMNGLELVYANVSITLGLPSEGAKLLSLINDIRWDMRVAHNQGDVLRVTTSFGNSNNSFQGVASGSYLINSLLSPQATIDIVDREAWDKIVSRDLVTDSLVPLTVNSTADLDVRTPLGEATISGITMINQTLWVKGLNGMDNGGKDRAVVSHLRVSGGNEWTVNFTVYNPSDLTVDIGAVPFDVFMEENGACFATIDVSGLDLRRGWSNFTSALTINPPNCKPEDVGEFFGKVIAGGVTNMTLRYSEFRREHFARRPFITGLAALKKGFGAMLVSEGYRLIQAIDILFSGRSTKAVVTIRGALPGSVSFSLVDMILYMPGSGSFEAAFNTTFENAVPTMIGRLPQVDITSKATKAEMAANLARLVGKDTKMNVQGRLGINWNGVESIINYAQGDIVVRVGDLGR